MKLSISGAGSELSIITNASPFNVSYSGSTDGKEATREPLTVFQQNALFDLIRETIEKIGKILDIGKDIHETIAKFAINDATAQIRSKGYGLTVLFWTMVIRDYAKTNPLFAAYIDPEVKNGCPGLAKSKWWVDKNIDALNEAYNKLS